MSLRRGVLLRAHEGGGIVPCGQVQDKTVHRTAVLRQEDVLLRARGVRAATRGRRAVLLLEARGRRFPRHRGRLVEPGHVVVRSRDRRGGGTEPRGGRGVRRLRSRADGPHEPHDERRLLRAAGVQAPLLRLLPKRVQLSPRRRVCLCPHAGGHQAAAPQRGRGGAEAGGALKRLLHVQVQDALVPRWGAARLADVRVCPQLPGRAAPPARGLRASPVPVLEAAGDFLGVLAAVPAGRAVPLLPRRQGAALPPCLLQDGRVPGPSRHLPARDAVRLLAQEVAAAGAAVHEGAPGGVQLQAAHSRAADAGVPAARLPHAALQAAQRRAGEHARDGHGRPPGYDALRHVVT
mmetsp:Transcript_11324/g.30293  ORF Transcript_11324/g.30293 Transcript_11324/m.30293 type:complete len:349 (+) Transcript_11324:500-1546(+)